MNEQLLELIKYLEEDGGTAGAALLKALYGPISSMEKMEAIANKQGGSIYDQVIDKAKGDFLDADVLGLLSNIPGMPSMSDDYLPTWEEFRGNYEPNEDGSTEGHWGALKTLGSSAIGGGIEPLLQSIFGKPSKAEGEEVSTPVDSKSASIGKPSEEVPYGPNNQLDIEAIIKAANKSGEVPSFTMRGGDTIKNADDIAFSRDTNTDGLDAIRNRVYETPGEREDRILHKQLLQKQAAEQEKARIAGLAKIFSNGGFMKEDMVNDRALGFLNLLK